MVRILLACAVVSMLLIGCSSLKERQDRAQNVYDATTEHLSKSIEGAKDVQEKFTESLSGASQALKATTSEFQERAEKIQDGISKVADAVQSGQDGVKDVQGALNVSGE